jgi:acyl carrier protein
MDTVKAMKNLEDILKDLGIPEDIICSNALIHQDLQLIVEVSLALKRKLGIKVKLETRQDKTLAEICTLIESALSETESQNSI